MKELLVAEFGGKCKICGYDKCISALEFHHLDPTKKEMGMSTRGYTKSTKTYRKEANKCILVCSNCHREIESGMIDLG